MMIDLDDLARDALTHPPTRTPELGTLKERVAKRRRRRRAVVGLAVPLVAVGALGAWSLLSSSEPEQIVAAGQDSGRSGQAESVAGISLGEFVWPAPARDFDSLEALTEGFITEVLGWDPADVRRSVGGAGTGPQSFSIANPGVNGDLRLVAVPSPTGWGFVQIGDGGLALEVGEDRSEIQFSRPRSADSSTVEVRFSDGSIDAQTTDGSSVLLPTDQTPEAVLSVLITFRTGDEVVGAVGGQFNVDGFEEPATELVVLPDLVGLDVAAALDAVASLGLTASVVPPRLGPDNATEALVVASTDPLAGSLVDAGRSVTLVLEPGEGYFLVDPTSGIVEIEHRVVVQGLAAGQIYSTAFIDQSEEFSLLIDELGIEVLPVVDFETTVVLYFGAVESSGCPLGEVQGLHYRPSDARLYPHIPADGSVQSCRLDARPAGILIAVDRDQLPEPPFELWINANEPPLSQAGGVTKVNVGAITGG